MLKSAKMGGYAKKTDRALTRINTKDFVYFKRILPQGMCRGGRTQRTFRC